MKRAKLQEESTKDYIIAFLLKEELIAEFVDRLYKAFDPEKKKSFAREDLMMFLGHFTKDGRMKPLDEKREKKVLDVSTIKNGKQITKEQLSLFIREYLKEVLIVLEEIINKNK